MKLSEWIAFALLGAALLSIFSFMTWYYANREVEPRDVKRTVEQLRAEVSGFATELKAGIEANQTQLESQRAWFQQAGKDIGVIQNELLTRGRWMEETQRYIDQATEDRWRKADAIQKWEEWLRIWEQFKTDNSSLRFN